MRACTLGSLKGSSKSRGASSPENMTSPRAGGFPDLQFTNNARKTRLYHGRWSSAPASSARSTMRERRPIVATQLGRLGRKRPRPSVRSLVQEGDLPKMLRNTSGRWPTVKLRPLIYVPQPTQRNRTKPRVISPTRVDRSKPEDDAIKLAAGVPRADTVRGVTGREAVRTRR